MAHVMAAIGHLVLRDKGQDLLEYGLLVALVALVAIAGVGTLGTTIFSVFWNGISHAL
jgi:Flp pilus assembly pilin Flp